MEYKKGLEEIEHALQEMKEKEAAKNQSDAQNHDKTLEEEQLRELGHVVYTLPLRVYYLKKTLQVN